MRDFKEHFFMLYNKLRSGENFSFSKYADGEYAILRNKNITNCDGWTFNPLMVGQYQQALLRSFHFNDPGYYVGVSCPCCVPRSHVEWMRANVGVDDDHLTWANIFVNANYSLFKKHFIPEFSNYDVILIASDKGNIGGLPFVVKKHYGISKTGWRDNHDLIQTLSKAEYKNKLFLFCAGPLGNILAHRLWETNKDNIYLDIGSTLNPWLVGNNRGYLKGTKTINKICTW